MFSPELALLVVAVVLMLPSIRIVQEGERLVVLRLGRFHRILGPGLNLVLWGVDSARRVRLDSVLPDWQSLSEQELAARLEHLATTGQLTPPS